MEHSHTQTCRSVYNLPLECFDYATLSILQTLDTTLCRFVATIKQRMVKESCILEYLCRAETSQETRVDIMMYHLPLGCVQDMFWLIQYTRIQVHRSFPVSLYVRYVYLPSTSIVNAAMYTTTFSHLLNGYSVFVNATANMSIHNMLAATTYKAPSDSMYGAMHQLWRELEKLTVRFRFNTESLPGTVEVNSWNANDIRLFKVDTYKHRVFLSPPFSLSTDIRIHPMSTYFREELPAATVRDIVLGLLTC